VRFSILGGGGFRVPLIARQIAASGLPVTTSTGLEEAPWDDGPGGCRARQAANDERNRSHFAEPRTGERAGNRNEADVAAGGYESVTIALASALRGG
jgi:hypothetical protein